MMIAEGTAAAFLDYVKLTVRMSFAARFTAVSVDTRGMASVNIE